MAARDWYARSGAQALRAASAVSFREYLARARSGNRAPATLDDDRRQIELDLARARASVREFVLRESDDQSDDGDGDPEEDARLAPILAMLRDILLAYSLVRAGGRRNAGGAMVAQSGDMLVMAQRNPRVGYVQGHADVVCFLIGNINERRDEEEVFWVYASLIERCAWRSCGFGSAALWSSLIYCCTQAQSLPRGLFRAHTQAARLPSGALLLLLLLLEDDEQLLMSCLSPDPGQQALQGARGSEARGARASSRAGKWLSEVKHLARECSDRAHVFLCAGGPDARDVAALVQVVRVDLGGPPAGRLALQGLGRDARRGGGRCDSAPVAGLALLPARDRQPHGSQCASS